MQSIDKKNKGVVCLTGDIHHMSMCTRDQKFLKQTEAEAALKYATICKKYGLSTTLFATGKLIEEEKENVVKLKEMGNVELGGHTYDGFSPRLFYKLSARLLNRANGPFFWQYRSVKRTCELFSDIGARIICWRNHAYRYDRNTELVLRKNSIKYWSDSFDMKAIKPYSLNGLVRVPINTLPDHEHMSHGYTGEKFLKNKNRASTGNRKDIYSPQEWVKHVLRQADYIVSNGGVATILSHPACMVIADEFKSFYLLCKGLTKYKAIFMRDLDIAI